MNRSIDYKFGVLLCGFLIVSGCSFIEVKRDETHSVQTYDHSFENTWDRLMGVLSDENETLFKSDREKGLILTGYDDISVQELARLGKMPPVHFSSGFQGVWLYARKKVDYSLYRVSPSETGVKMTLYLQGYNASGKRWVNIPPNGTGEGELFNDLRQVLSSG